ncbi:MAG TPA: diguanylate cyclase [Telmatospirillum sp.]|nr:diguanylate cyclase [Telmatospirillum sp.]
MAHTDRKGIGKEAKLIICGAIALSLAVIAIAAFSVYQSRLQVEDRAFSSAENVAHLLDQSISSLMVKSDSALRSLVEETELRLAAGGILDDSINDYIARIIRLNPELVSVRLVSPDGTIRFGVDNSGARLLSNSSPKVNVSDRDYFSQARDAANSDVVITPPFFGRLTTAWIMQLVRRVSLPDGRFAGIAYITLDIQYLEQSLRAADLGPHSSVSLRTSDHSLVARYVPSDNSPTKINDKMISDGLREMVSRDPEGGRYAAVAAPDGIFRYFAYRRTKAYPGYVNVGVAAEDIAGEWQREAAILAALTILFGLTLAIAAKILSVAMVRKNLAAMSLGESQEVVTALINTSPDAALLLNADGIILAANKELSVRFNTKVDDLLGRQFFDLLPSELSVVGRAECQKVIASGVPIHYQHERGGMIVENHVHPVRSGNGGFNRIAVFSCDITERKRAEEKLREMARTDPLTGLANRRASVEAIEAEHLRTNRFDSDAALLMIDIDHFKQINDGHGHEAGDQALVALATTLKTVVRATDLAGRFGGEEFVVLLVGSDLSGAVEMAERIRVAVAQIVVTSPSGDFGFTVSIGVAKIMNGDKNWSEALSRADKAMYEAKGSGRNQVVAVSIEHPTP